MASEVRKLKRSIKNKTKLKNNGLSLGIGRNQPPIYIPENMKIGMNWNETKNIKDLV